MKSSSSTNIKNSMFFNAIGRLFSAIKKNTRLMDAYKFTKYYLSKSAVDIEINEATALVVNSRRNFYLMGKNCLVPEYYKGFVLGKGGETIIYRGKEYKLEKIFVAQNDVNSKGYYFKTNDGSYLYQILGLKTSKEDKAIAVLWLKNNEISKQNEKDTGKLIQTVFSGTIESPFSIQSVNPRTKKSNVFVTIITFPFGFIAGAIKYIGFKVPSLFFGIINYIFKGFVYGGFFLLSVPFLPFKSVRRANKELFFYLIGKQVLTLEEIHSQELAKKDGSFVTSFTLMNIYGILVLNKSFSSFLDIIRKPLSFAINVLACLIQGGINMFNSVVYGDSGYADIAKQQIRQSVVRFRDSIRDPLASFFQGIKEFNEIKNTQNLEVRELEKKGAFKQEERSSLKIEHVFKNMNKKEELKTLSIVLQGAGVREASGELSYYSRARAVDHSLKISKPSHSAPIPA